MPRLLTPLAFAICLGPATAALACVPGTKCLIIPDDRKSAAPYAVGETLPRGKYNVLLNTRYHGLPASDGSFWYYKVGRYVFKVDARSHTVLEDVTRDARRLLR